MSTLAQHLVQSAWWGSILSTNPSSSGQPHCPQLTSHLRFGPERLETTGDVVEITPAPLSLLSVYLACATELFSVVAGLQEFGGGAET